MQQPLHRLQRVGTASIAAGAPGYTYDKYHKAQKRSKGLRLQTVLALLSVTVVLGGLFALASFHLMPTAKIHLRRTLAQDGAASRDASATQAQPVLAGHQQLGVVPPAQLTSPTGTAGQRAKGGRDGEDHYIPALKADVESLIAEATAVARERGIQTDTDAAAALQGLAEHPTIRSSHSGEDDAALPAVAKCKAEDCQPHGTCENGSCRCVALYTGRHCGHAVRLSWPLFPAAMKQFRTAYDGEIIMSRRSMTRGENITVYQPDDPTSETESEGSYKLVANATRIQELMKVLPEEDLAIKGHAYMSCAVVGSSGSLLQQSLGPEIDSHHIVLRFNNAPTIGWEKHVGGKTNLRLTDMTSWGWHEKQSEVVLVHTTTPEVLEGLAWNLQQEQPWNVLALNPDFESYMAKSFAFKPSTGFYGIMLALHSCRAVTAYGFLEITRRGAPVRYFDSCDPQDALNIDAAENTILKAFVEAGVLRLGEACAIECLEAASPTADRLCQACKEQKGLRLGETKCDGKRTRSREPWVVPWEKKQ